MAETLYTEEHEWVRLDAGGATVGISVYAAGQLGDIVYVELPDIGRRVVQGEEAAVVESVKAASEVYAPVSGEVVEVNATLRDQPEAANADPEGNGWFFRLKLDSPPNRDKLMTKAAYDKFLQELG
jgi:glycine cleavage system H protein